MRHKCSGASKNIILLTDGEGSVSDSVLNSAKESGVVIYVIGIGCDENSTVLNRIANVTGGEFYTAKLASEIVDIYSTIGLNQRVDMTDTDGDGLADTFEISGMRLSDGRIVYTDPTKADTDGDGLKDGEEIYLHSYQIISGKLNDDGTYTENFTTGYQFFMTSDPRKVDSDGDGIPDNEDTAPLEIGIGNGVIGEISIVSCYKDGESFTSGHSFLVYKSYINDSLDFSNFYGVYKKELFNNASYFSIIHGSDMNDYTINKSEYISLDVAASGIGGSSASSSSNNNSSYDTKFNFNAVADNLDGGAWVDWEFWQVIGGNANYTPNLALTKEITEAQLNDIINCYRENNRYSIYTNNCAKIATEAWNKAFNDNLSAKGLFYTPENLKSSISSRENSYEIDIGEILRGMGFNVD